MIEVTPVVQCIYRQCYNTSIAPGSAVPNLEANPSSNRIIEEVMSICVSEKVPTLLAQHIAKHIFFDDEYCPSTFRCQSSRGVSQKRILPLKVELLTCTTHRSITLPLA